MLIDDSFQLQEHVKEAYVFISQKIQEILYFHLRYRKNEMYNFRKKIYFEMYFSEE